MASIGGMFTRPHEAFTAGFYRNEDFDFELRIALGQAASRGAEVGEVLQAVAGVGEHDTAAWFQAWLGLGDRTVALADGAASAGHTLSASEAYLRAANYYGTALNAVDGLDSEDELLPTFRKHRAAWDRFVDTTPLSAERVALPYEAGQPLPGYFFAPDEGTEPRPTLVMVNGSDGAISVLLGSGGYAALARGYNVLLFDGPGQQSMLFERNVPFRPDWEAVVTPIVDYLLARPDVDGAKLALYGISQAGYWVPRTLAFEHRFAAAIADPGVVDVATSWTSHMPKSMIKLFEDGDKKKFDQQMEIGLKFQRGAARTWAFRARPYQVEGYFDVIAEVSRYTVKDVAGQITTPLFITDPEDEQFWPGQSEQLAALVPGSTLQRFTAAEGANFHCQPLARTLTDQRMFDWLDEQLGR